MTVTLEANAMEYDYIVCGGGTSGAVVGARLSEDPDVTVLVIEAGADSKEMENVNMAGAWSKGFDAETDWNILSEPNSGVNNRQVKESRGKYLGGSSGCNGTLCVRGTKGDYGSWDLPGWSDDEMWRYMAKAETFHNKDWFEADPEKHGYDGPLHIEPMELAPISNLLLQSMQSQGLPLQHDMFTSGDNPHGCGHAPRTVYKGMRTTSADFLRVERSNLDVLVETTVDKVILSKERDDMRATAVSAVGKKGGPITIKAKKEIIVSGGAYCTPPILLRSGIGPKNELEKMHIDCKVELPGVGKNLMDHLIVFIFYETEEAGLTKDHLLYHDNNMEESYRLWKEEQKGALSHVPFGAFAYARLDERLADDEGWRTAPREKGKDPMGLLETQPHTEYFTVECYGGPNQFADFPTEHKHCFAIIAELFGPRSKGAVTLKSKDPMDNPVVDHNYLADPLDLTVLSEACTFANEIVVKGSGTKDILKGAWPKTLTHHAYTNREDWKPYVRDNATTCYHPAGSAKMGKSGDPMAVLDERLRVRGVKGLRVADVSVMPLLNQGHPQMPAYGIGEKCADMIKEDARQSSTYSDGVSNVEMSGRAKI
ncbi:MAG: hypothetical protein M1827_004609 [Pycnora praestabilis]|nr:MAG: hypothetical protein M1827_004609 [Pycnora praestabilis]